MVVDLIKDLFSPSDVLIMKVLDRKVYIRNGLGYGFISDSWLYNNNYLTLGFGRSVSGYGDWGGGFDRASTCPLTITIDKDFIIRKIETDSFYNSRSSKVEEKKAIRIKKFLKVGQKFKIKDKFLLESLQELFKIMPIKQCLGWDVFHSPHMLDHYLKGDYKYDYIEDPNINNLKEDGGS